MGQHTGAPGAHIGRRVNELRLFRNMSLRTLADLTGGAVSAGNLSKIERGLASCDSRPVIDALAAALKVAPRELLETPLPAKDPVSREAHEALGHIADALSHNWLGHPFSEQAQPWPEIEADLRLVVEDLHPRCEYVRETMLLPSLIERLYTAHAADPAHRREALLGLVQALRIAAADAKHLGADGLPSLAAVQMRYVAEELGDPAWVGVAEWQVAQAGSGDRSRMHAVSLKAVERLQADADPRVRQICGMLHLNAAMASAVTRRSDDAIAHLDEAQEMVKATAGAPNFAGLCFGAPNWTVWRISVGVELGEGPKVAEVGQGLDVSLLASANRQASYYGDMARGLAQDRRTRDRAVALMRQAEDIAPQLIRTNPYMQEAVNGLMRRRQAEAVGRELRGMAYRMGLAV